MESGLSFKQRVALQLLIVSAAVAVWSLLSVLQLFPRTTFPSPMEVVSGFGEEIRAGRLFNDLIASLFRVASGFCLATLLGVPLGLWLALHSSVRAGALPAINFFRSLSPLAWIPFAILWFGVGDLPVVFLIFMSTFFPILLATIASVANIPIVYFRVAEEYGFRGTELLTRVVLAAILPQLITTIRVAAGVAWLVVVAAEMIAGRDGLGFAIWDARNGLRTDLLVCNMVVIGIIGIGLDRLLMQLTRMPSVQWGYER
jgi:NitT/TauT family transport system permease protein